MNPLVISSILMAGLFLGFILGFEVNRRRTANALVELAQFKLRYRQFYGWHEWFGTYDLESFDGGKSWYAMLTRHDDRRVVRGPAELIYPGLLSESGILAVESMQPITYESRNQRFHAVALNSSNQSPEYETPLSFEAIEKQRQKHRDPVLRERINKQQLCGRFLLSEICGESHQ